MEADDRERLARRRGDGRDARARALRLVDHDVDEREPAEEVERPRAPLLRHPSRLAELDRHGTRGQTRGHRLEEGVTLARRREPLRHLKEDVRELAGGAERLEGGLEAPPYLV